MRSKISKYSSDFIDATNAETFYLYSNTDSNYWSSGIPVPIFNPVHFPAIPLLFKNMGNEHQILLFLCFFLLVVAVRTQPTIPQPDVTGYSCSNSSSLCDTYVFYRAQAPYFLDLLNISDLFGVQRVQVAEASNLASTTISVVDGQPLLVPIKCGCMGNYSQANITYTIFGGDTFYLISSRKFENLTTYQAVEATNPTLIVTDLQIGSVATIPIRCKCPSEAQGTNGTKMLITYVVDPGDTPSNISQTFGADLQNLISANGINSTLTPYRTLLVPVSQKPVLGQPSPSPPQTNVVPINNTISSGGRSYRGVVVWVSVGGAVTLVFHALFVFCVLRTKGQSDKQTNISEGPKPPSSRRIRSFGRNNLRSRISDCIEKPLLYSIEEIQKATQNFSPLCNIKGSVFKGTIDGKDYAIKLTQGDISQELRLLQKVNHANLVKLEGFCTSSEGRPVLIYEYAENGSLNTLLHHPESVQNMTAIGWSSASLPWKTRLQVALDVANGLQYIHEHTTPSVVHKDIKSSNILLDGKFRAKIANFGMAKSRINAFTKHITGTKGYMAPEYIAHGFVSPKIDVFAFGVVLLELISGKEAIVRDGGVPLEGKAGLLWTQIKPLLDDEDREEKLTQWVDGDLQNACSSDSVVGLAIIASACVEENPTARPTFSEIVYSLSTMLEACTSGLEDIVTASLAAGR